MSQLLKAEISLTFLVLIEINAESVSHEDFLDFFLLFLVCLILYRIEMLMIR